MRIIIAPAKKMIVGTDSFAADSLPQSLEQTKRLKAVLQAMSHNGSIAKLNVERLKHMDLRHNLTPAVLSYEGIQHRYIAPGVMEASHLDYLRKHLRILSGFYGLLRPFDSVTPYRLEMQDKLTVDNCRDLCQFWVWPPGPAVGCRTGYGRALSVRENPFCLPRTFGEWKSGKVI